MQNRKMQLAMAALFCAFIAAFALAYVFLPKQSFSENEKRVLAGFPEFSAADVKRASRTGCPITCPGATFWWA